MILQRIAHHLEVVLISPESVHLELEEVDHVPLGLVHGAGGGGAAAPRLLLGAVLALSPLPLRPHCLD